MKIQDLKYLLSFILPVATYFSIHHHGIFSWMTPIIGFIFVPITEALLPPNASNEVIIHEGEKREGAWYFKFLLYLNLPIILFLLCDFYQVVTKVSNMDAIGKTVSLGVLLGANAINVAHELGHKSGILNKWAAKLLLLPCFYPHFTIQHNRGHHLNVGTPEDPATAKYNESVYFFWIRCIPATIRQAIALEIQQLKKSGKAVISLYNEMVVNALCLLVYIGVVGMVWGISALIFGIIAGFISILLLETINYVEHYGLSRKKMENGRYERVELFHSWNSNHVLGRIMLFELTRHADHHYKANKNYQMLLHYDDSPQLPLGYPGSMILSLIPPLWFKIINPIIEQRKTISPA